MPTTNLRIILLLIVTSCLLAATAKHPRLILPFSLSDVDLLDEDFKQGAALNHEYLLMLEVDNLLFNFRTTAGLAAPGQSYGGWEGPTVEVRGQFVGHYLSALALAYKSTGDKVFKRRADEVIDGLSQVQEAWGDGYLSAFPKSFWDRLESLQPVWAPYYVIHKIMAGLLDQHQLVSQPKALDMLLKMASYHCGRCHSVIQEKGKDHWYQVLETEFGGMNDVLYRLALETDDSQWADCAALFDKPAWLDPLVQGRDILQGLHANTHLAQINGFVAKYEATGDEAAALAVIHFFNLVAGNHSFSTGGSNWFERWGPPGALADAINNPDAAANTQESCTTYNILKIARSLFQWTGMPAFADFYERAWLNGVLGVQRVAHNNHHHHHHHGHGGFHSHHHSLHGSLPVARGLSRRSMEAIQGTNAMHGTAFVRPANYQVVSWPDDPALNLIRDGPLNRESDDEPGQPGQYIYYMPLGHEGSKGKNPRAWTRGWGDPFNTFWCCYGTAIESFSKLADSVYFWREGKGVNAANDEGHRRKPIPDLFINQMTSSRLRWEDLGVTIELEANLYSEKDNVARALITVSVDDSKPGNREDSKPACFNLYWRVPGWTIQDKGVRVSLNGKPPYTPLSSGLTGATGTDSFIPPDFGAGSNYIVLGPEWNDGDRLEVEMGMRIAIEDLNDRRPDVPALKAILMGPFHMAGITDQGERVIDIDASEIHQAVRFLNESVDREPGKRKYPKGARMLVGKTKQYVIAPIGQLIDEAYTAYFEFTSKVPSPDEMVLVDVEDGGDAVAAF